MNETRNCLSRAKTQRLSHPLESLVPRNHLAFVFDKWRRTFGRVGLYDLRSYRSMRPHVLRPASAGASVERSRCACRSPPDNGLRRPLMLRGCRAGRKNRSAFRLIERFQEKWNPVFRPKTRQSKNLEHFIRFCETVKCSRARSLRSNSF